MAIPSKTFAEFGKEVAWLGKIVAVHTIGEYEIVEYHPKIVIGSSLTDQIDTESSRFSVYISGVKTGQSYYTLDMALAGAIAHRIEGGNHHADYYFMRMLGLE